jgi:hypothetical protein
MKAGAPWRKDVPQRFKEQIAAQAPFKVEPLKEYLRDCNTGMQAYLAPLVRKAPKRRSGYDILFVQCTDARTSLIRPEAFLRYNITHRRIAGNIAGNCEPAEKLNLKAHIIVEGHYGCGAVAAVRNAKGLQDHDGNITTNLDMHVLLSGIPTFVTDKSFSPRTAERVNARAQAGQFTEYLISIGRTDISVYPAYHNWHDGQNRYEWLGRTAAELPPVSLRERIEKSSGEMYDYAVAEGRTYATQYATHTTIYDPSRMGFMNPRMLSGALGNEKFCVSTHFDSFKDGGSKRERRSKFSIPSILYAGYDYDEEHRHHGHVAGVGGRDGTHILAIMDPDAGVISRVKNYLLQTYPVIRELTDNGERILSMVCHPGSLKVDIL